MFAAVTAPGEDLLHLPDGRSLRRIRAPHLKGGLIFAYEDITDRLTARREYNALMNVQQEILNSIEEAVLIFASNGRLQFYNQAYVNLWDADEIMLQKEPSFAENFFQPRKRLGRIEKGHFKPYLQQRDRSFQLKPRRRGAGGVFFFASFQ